MRASKASPDTPYLAQQVPKSINTAKGLALGTPGYMASSDKIQDIRQPENQASPRSAFTAAHQKCYQSPPKIFYLKNH